MLEDLKPMNLNLLYKYNVTMNQTIFFSFYSLMVLYSAHEAFVVNHRVRVEMESNMGPKVEKGPGMFVPHNVAIGGPLVARL